MHSVSVHGGVEGKRNGHFYPMSLFSAGLGLALVRSGWIMLPVLGMNHVFSPAQTGELG